MDTSVTSVTSRKRKRNEEEEDEEELEEETILIVIAVGAVAVLLCVMAFWCKRRERKRIMPLMKEVVKSLKELVQLHVTEKEMEIKDAQEEVVHEVLNELKNIPNLNGANRYKAIDWLAENPMEFAIVKSLPLDDKEDYIMAFMP